MGCMQSLHSRGWKGFGGDGVREAGASPSTPTQSRGTPEAWVLRPSVAPPVNPVSAWVHLVTGSRFALERPVADRGGPLEGTVEGRKTPPYMRLFLS
jgi:hypothetical protein